ncbi:MAG: DUF370 domain-containing protein [Clostridia bacterium]|nr:DUF370 domain-containing protein [Clostridia bacterium]
MFLHAGENVTVKKKDIVGIFDIDNTVTPAITKDFLRKAQRDGRISSAGSDLPKSFIITSDGKKQKVIFSHISAKTLTSRAELPLS